MYDRKRFVDGGFRHYDLYFPDGSCPTEAILLKFLEIAESEPGAWGVMHDGCCGVAAFNV